MSPGQDTMVHSALERRNLPALFAALPLLRELNANALAELANEIEWFSLPGGAPLYSSGQPADGLYVIVNGAFGVYAAHSGGGARLVGNLTAGQAAGEKEVISGSPRSTTLVALRDSEVARLSISTFNKLIGLHPRALQLIAKGLAEQLDSLQQGQQRRGAVPKTLAIVPHGPGFAARGVAMDLVACLRHLGRAELISSQDATERTTHWFHRLERANDFVVYLTDDQPTNWSRLCLRQADLLLLVADAQHEPRPWRALDCFGQAPSEARTAEILLVSQGAGRSSGGRWLLSQPCRRLHHVHNIDDIARIARLLTGNSVGLVLSGGGARGFAHIGVMRALRESGIIVDTIGASSIGSIIGAGWAADWDYQEMLARMRRSFVASNPLSDYTLPLISLVSGRKVTRLMQREFGDTEIEDLRLPYYCVSANLTSGQLAVHRRGTLWKWLRASVAIPGVLPPVFTERQAFVDGATLNNLPVDVMREEFAGSIVAVDAGADGSFVSDLEMTETPPLWRIPGLMRRGLSGVNIMRILLRAGMLNSAITSISQRELADLLLRPPLQQIDLLDWRAFDRAIEIGYRYAARMLETHGHKLIKRAIRPAAAG